VKAQIKLGALAALRLTLPPAYLEDQTQP
jgi:hypothetical protein